MNDTAVVTGLVLTSLPLLLDDDDPPSGIALRKLTCGRQAKDARPDHCDVEESLTHER